MSVTVAAAAAVTYALSGPAAAKDEPPITVGGGSGWIGTTIFIPGSPKATTPKTQVAGQGQSTSAAVTCGYTLDISNPANHAGDYPGLHDPGHVVGVDGSFYYRSCSDGTQGLAWVPNAAPAPPTGAAVSSVTLGRLALEARNRLVLPQPTLHRSPSETHTYRGEPFTWVNLWMWFWTDIQDYRVQTQTTSAGPVSATVVARPVGLVFDPGEGSAPVRCVGPGRAWTEADGDDEPASGCGFRYRHVTDGMVTARLKVVWGVTWTGSGGTGGALPAMETVTAAPLRVLQVQVVNR